MACSRRGAAALVLVLLSGAAALVGNVPSAQAAVSLYGYIPMPDGAELHYMLVLPAAGGRFPTVFTYDDYAAGSNGNTLLAAANAANGFSPDGSIGTDYVSHGYAYIGVNLRGTGCSTGTGNIGDVDTWGRDGAQVVEWIARQAWSDGHVGMVGGSFQGMTQLGVAGFNPPHLDAISPLSVTTDFYRDIDYPGGIPNEWMTEYPTAVEPALTAPALADAAQHGDTSCGAFNPARASSNVVATGPTNATTGVSHPFFDSLWANDIEARVSRVHIPVFGCLTWQDDAVSSRATEIYLTELPRATTWFEGNNGGHVSCDLPGGLLFKFFDHYLKGVDNGFLNTPHILLAHEANAAIPAWYTHLASWSTTVQPVRLYLHAGELMNLAPPTGQEAADTYLYPTPSTPVQTWQNTYDLPNGSAIYTTPPLAADAEFFGPASVDFWLSSSTATDADVQITLSESRPDGQEQYLARGWLRMSHRALDPTKSTVLRPFLTDLPSDAAPLASGQATAARLELWPFDHVFRKGSSIRIAFDTPAVRQASSSGFISLQTPTQNTILHDGLHISSVVLPLLPGFGAQAAIPACGSVSQEPCRTNMGAVPSGLLTIPTGKGPPGGPAPVARGGAAPAATSSPSSPNTSAWTPGHWPAPAAAAALALAVACRRRRVDARRIGGSSWTTPRDQDSDGPVA